VQDYLKSQPNDADYEQLLEALGGIIYSDNDVAIDEAYLLNSLPQKSTEQPVVTRLSTARSLLSRLDDAYQKWKAG
jgi:chromosome condensin MukBEF ATPase and DNA-binding subunit MukB